MKGDRKEAFVDAALLYPPDVLEMFQMTPRERLVRTAEIWDMYRAYGGSFDPDIDFQSPFFDRETPVTCSPYGGTSVRLVRRS